MSAIIQKPKRVTSENVTKDQKNAVDQVGFSVNTFMEEIYIAIMGNLGVNSNLNMEFSTITIKVDVSGTPTTTTKFKSNISGRVEGVMVISARKAAPTAHPFITFSQNGQLVEITNIIGLTADTEYELKILSIGS